MPYQAWTPWYQPADIVIDTTMVGLWGYNLSETSRVSRGTTEFPDFSGVDFPAEAAALAAGDGPTVGAGLYDDFATQGPAWNDVSNYPIYGVGFRGSAVGATEVFPAPSWNYQGESSLVTHTTAGLWTRAATTIGLDPDPALPWNAVDLPPGVTSWDDSEWEHPLYPWQDAVDYVGTTQFVWQTASAQFISGYVRAAVDGSDSAATNDPWTLNIHVYDPESFSDMSFFHPHASPTSLSMYEGIAATDVDVSLSAGSFPSGFPALAPITTVDPGWPDTPGEPVDIVHNLAALGYPTIAVSFTHAGMVGGSWNWDVGDGSVDAHNTQRAAVDAEVYVVLRPSRVRHLYTYEATPNLAGGPDKNRRRFETPGSLA